MRRLAGLLLLALAPGLASAQATPAPADRARRVDSLFARFDDGPSPGLAVAVERDGRILFEKGYGLADLEHRVHITPTTVFDIASLSKQFTGLAVAMLVEEGRIGLGDDIRKYIPELHDFGAPITVDHLLHHTSGLRDWPGTLALSGWRFDDVIAFDQILRMAYAQRTLNFAPGSEYTYSNTGYNLLAEMIRRVTGTPFAAFMDERIFRPLGMTRTRVRDDHTIVIPDRATGYARAASASGTGRGALDGWRETPNALVALGSSSTFSTVEDLARWVANFDDARVGGRAAMELSRRRGVLTDGSTIPYAFGISHGELRGQPTLSHSGGWASFATFILHFPKQHLGVVVLSNGGGVNPARAAQDVAAIFLDGEAAPPAAAGATVAGAPTLPAAALDAYAGTYRLGPGWYLRVRRDGTTLRVRATREDEISTTPRSATEFWVDAYGASITFQRDPAGTVTGLRYRGRTAPRVGGVEPPPDRPLAALVGDYDSEELATTYRVELHGDSLVMRHRRLGTFALTRAWGDDFGGDAWFLRSVAFERDATGRVTGLVVNVDERSRDIRFVRRAP